MPIGDIEKLKQATALRDQEQAADHASYLQLLAVDPEAGGESIGKCKDCREWEARGNGIMGDCLCKKVLDCTKQFDYEDALDGISFWSNECQPVRVCFVTGRDFGCVHFELSPDAMDYERRERE